jgi:hypothetical protein
VFLATLGAEETPIAASFCEAIRIAREQKSVSLQRCAEAAGGKRIGTARAASASARRAEDIIGKGSAVAERMPVIPQTVLLRSELSPA